MKIVVFSRANIFCKKLKLSLERKGLECSHVLRKVSLTYKSQHLSLSRHLVNDWQTRQTLLMRAKNPNDQEAWEDFEHYYRDFLRMVIYKVVRHQRFSDDLLQSVLLEIWRSLSRFEIDEQRAKFRTWMSRLVRNTVLDHLKKESKQDKIVRERPKLDSTPSELDEMIQREWEIHLSRLAMKNIAERFSGKAIQVFQMSLDGNEVEEICCELSLSKDSVYTLKNRVKKYLIREIKKLREELEL